MENSDLKGWQISQQKHDLSNHFDIICLHKSDRMKHYGLHFAKYVGRLARNRHNESELKRTLVDAFLIALSAANCMNQKLEIKSSFDRPTDNDFDFYFLADAVGRFADACEKIDHFEECRNIAIEANLDILSWIIDRSNLVFENFELAVKKRREFLSHRQAYHGEE